MALFALTVAFTLAVPAAAQGAGGTGPAADSLSPHAYLDRVLDLVRGNSINRDSVDWETIRPAARARVAAGNTSAAAYPAIRWVLGRLGDRHSRFMSPEEAAESQRGQFRGFGLHVLYPEGIVAQVYAGGPADRAGVRVGDVVTAVNGAGPEADVTGVLADLPPADTVRLSLRQSHGRLREVVLAASRVEMNRLPGARRMAGGIGYLELPELVGPGTIGDSASYADAGQEALRRADAPPACGWIVDLRRNAGGNMWPMLAAAGPLLGDSVVGAFVFPDAVHWWSYRQGRAMVDGHAAAEVRDPYPVRGDGPPVALLTSRITASSGEAVTIAFRGRQRMRSFGEATRGLPTANVTMTLPDGALLFLTAAVDADRTGRAYRTRIEPDEQARTDWPSFGGGDDPAIVAAAAWLRAQPECGGRDRAR